MATRDRSNVIRSSAGNKFVHGALFSLAIVIAPALGNRQVLALPQLWIMLALGILAHLLQPAYKVFDPAAPAEDQNTARQILWSCALVQVAGIMEAVYCRYPESFQWDPIATVALGLMLLGLLLRSWAVLTLGQFFTWHVTCQPGQQVIRTGPYQWVRHPGYLGAFLTCCCGPIFLHAWVTAIAGGVVLLVAFLRRIRHEEALLRRNLGQDYDTYCGEVPALIPWLW